MKKIIVFICMLTCIISLCSAQIGSVDTTYYKQMGSIEQMFDVLVAHDSSIFVVGAFRAQNQREIYYINKLRPDGSNDHSFNPGSGLNSWGRVLRRQSDGKIIVGGDFTTYNGTGRVRLARLDSTGTLDGTFTIGSGFNNSVFDVYIQSDSKIVVTGSFTTFNGTTVGGIVRLNTDGSRDTSFHSGSGGNSEIHSVDRASDGTFIISGNFTSFNGTAVTRIAKLNSNGSIDSTYNSGGAGANVIVYDALFLPNGKVIAAGNFTTYNGATATRIVRLKTNGTMDSTFTSGTGFNALVAGLTLQTNGKILATGQFSSYNGTSISRIARMDSTGTRDTTFNPGAGFDNLTYNSILAPDNKIYVVGGYYRFDNRLRLFLTRLNTNGSIDHTFWSESKLNNSVEDAAFQSNGKLILGGNFTYFNNTSVNRIARMNSDGTMDTTFQSGTGANSVIRAVYVLSNDKILIGGDFTSYNGTSINRIARLNSNGALDTSFHIGTGANASVYALSANYNGKLYAGGNFTSINGTTKNRLVGLNSDGSIDANFNIGTGCDGIVHDIKIQSDSKLLVGGAFTTYNSVTYNRLLRLDTLAAVDGTFTIGTGANNDVRCIAFDRNGKVFIGGGFTTYNGASRTRLVKLQTNGLLDSTFNANIYFGSGASVFVNSILPYNNCVLAGGNFDYINSVYNSAFGAMDSVGGVTSYFSTGTGVSASGANIPVLLRDTLTQRVLVGGTMVTLHQLYLGFSFIGLQGTYDYGVTAIDSVLAPASQCVGAASSVRFKNLKPFNAKNRFTVQLSDSSGSFTSPTTIGTKTAAGIAGWESVNVTIPGNALLSTHYKVRVLAANPLFLSAASAYFTINPVPSAPVAPAHLNLYCDTICPFEFYNVLSGAGGDKIQWSWDENFELINVIDSGDTIAGHIAVNLRDTVWIRSLHSQTGCTSASVIGHVGTTGVHKILETGCAACDACGYVNNGCFESHDYSSITDPTEFDSKNNFEDILSCWGKWWITPDYFEEFHPSSFYQIPGPSPVDEQYQAEKPYVGATGDDAFIGMWNCYNPPNAFIGIDHDFANTEAAYTVLNQDLISGEKYTLSFYVKVSSNSECAFSANQRQLRLAVYLNSGPIPAGIPSVNDGVALSAMQEIYPLPGTQPRYFLEYPCPVCAQPPGADANGWYHEQIIFTAPAGLNPGQRLVISGIPGAVLDGETSLTPDPNVTACYFNLDEVSISPVSNTLSVDFINNTNFTPLTGSNVNLTVEICNTSGSSVTVSFVDNLGSSYFNYIPNSITPACSTCTVTYAGGILTYSGLTIGAHDCEQFTFTATYFGSNCEAVINHASALINGGGCSGAAGTTVTFNAFDLEGDNETVVVPCGSTYPFSDPIGPNVAIPSGQQFNYTYNWTPAVGLSNPHVLNPNLISDIIATTSPGYYELAITNIACNTVTYWRVYVHFGVLGTISFTEPTCHGDNDGTATINEGNILFGDGPYTYLWDDNSTDVTREDLLAGIYMVTITDANSCSGTASVTVTEPAEFNATVSTSSSCFFGTDAYLTMTGGTPPYNRFWNLAGGGFPTITNNVVENLLPGNYSVLAYDSRGCIDLEEFTMPNPYEVEVDVTQPTCSTYYGSFCLTPNGFDPPYSYQWSQSFPPTLPGGCTSWANPGVISTVTVTDAEGCSAIVSIPINAPGLIIDLEPTHVECNGGSDGSITTSVSDGVAPFTFNWSNSATTQNLSGLSAGTYTVTITDDNSCSSSASVTIIEPDLLEIDITSSANPCIGGNISSIETEVTGGTTTYTYLWSNSATTDELNNIPPGNYTLTVTDANSCSASASVSAYQPASTLAVASPSVTNICNTPSSGAIDIGVSGGTSSYTYLWSNSATTQDITGLPTGLYTVLVTDANNCTASATASVTMVVGLSVNHVDVPCTGYTNGTIDLTITSGTPTYTYSWNDGPTTQDRTGLAVGSYTVTVTDNTSCSNSATAAIIVNASGPPASISTSPSAYINTCLSDVQEITLTLNSTICPTCSISWQSPLSGSSSTNTVTEPGTYTVDVVSTLVGGCSTSAEIVIEGNITCCQGDVIDGYPTLTHTYNSANYTLLDIQNMGIPAGTTVTLTGEFILGMGAMTVSFDDIHFLMAGNSKITVSYEQTLNLVGCWFNACNEMWDGIYVEDVGAIEMGVNKNGTRCVLDNAMNGVMVLGNNAKGNIVDVDFHWNYRSVQFILYYPADPTEDYQVSGCSFGTGGGVQLPPPSGFPEYNNPLYGVFIKDCAPMEIPNTLNTGFEENAFDNLNCGIYVEGTNLSVGTNSFVDIQRYDVGNDAVFGSAIYSTGATAWPSGDNFALVVSTDVSLPGSGSDVNFRNCFNGVKATLVPVSVYYNHMNNVVNGIFTSNCRENIVVESNRITNASFGVSLVNNSSALNSVNSNIITVNDPTGFLSNSTSEFGSLFNTYGIFQSSISNAVPVRSAIFENEISNGRTCIELINTNGTRIYNNILHQNSTTEVIGRQAGIKATYCANVNIQDNTVDGNDDDYLDGLSTVPPTLFTESSIRKSGITLNNTPSGDVCGNILGDASDDDLGIGYGLHFIGNCEQVNVYSNDMNFSKFGMALESGGSIPRLQPEMGRNGPDYYTHQNNFNGDGTGSHEFSGDFRTYTFTNNANYTAPIFWFSGSLAAANVLYTEPSGSPSSNANAIIPQALSSSSTGYDCSPLVWPSPFRHRMKTGVDGDIAIDSAEKYMEAGFELTGKWLAEKMLYTHLEEDTAIRNNDSILLAFYLLKQNTDLGQIMAYELKVKEMLDSLNVANESSASKAEQALGLLNNISLGNAQAANYKNVNDIFIDILTVDLEELLEINVNLFTAGQKHLLDSIANLCPYTGGDAVYIARSLYSLVDNGVAYDDEDICLTESSSKKENEPIIKEHTNSSIEELVIVYPNPTKDVLFLSYLAELNGKTTFELIDVLGRVVKSVNVNTAENLKQIRTDNVAGGVYQWRLIDEVRLVKAGKVIITR